MFVLVPSKLAHDRLIGAKKFLSQICIIPLAPNALRLSLLKMFVPFNLPL